MLVPITGAWPQILFSREEVRGRRYALASRMDYYDWPRSTFHRASFAASKLQRTETMTMRRWMLVIAALALILGVVMRLIAPIVWDRQGRARDDTWLKEKSGDFGVR